MINKIEKSYYTIIYETINEKINFKILFHKNLSTYYIKFICSSKTLSIEEIVNSISNYVDNNYKTFWFNK